MKIALLMSCFAAFGGFLYGYGEWGVFSTLF